MRCKVILYRAIFIVICAFGIYLGIFDNSMDSFMGNGTALNYYTLQSNIWVLILEIFLFVFSLIEYKNDKKIIGEKMIMFKFIVTVAITLTFVVFWCMLAPYLGIKYVFTLSNIFVHTLTPILMIIDFFVYDKEIQLKKKFIPYTIIPPLYYFIFVVIRAKISDVALTAGSRYPYWFIDLDAFGWFGNENGLGVIYWVFFISILVFGMGYVFYRLKKVKN